MTPMSFPLFSICSEQLIWTSKLTSAFLFALLQNCSLLNVRLAIVLLLLTLFRAGYQLFCYFGRYSVLVIYCSATSEIIYVLFKLVFLVIVIAEYFLRAMALFTLWSELKTFSSQAWHAISITLQFYLNRGYWELGTSKLTGLTFV